MILKQKQLTSKCRSCGNTQTLDSGHRAGSYLMKSVPQNMSEIDTTNKGGISENMQESEKKEEEEVEQVQEN